MKKMNAMRQSALSSAVGHTHYAEIRTNAAETVPQRGYGIPSM